MKRTRLVYGIAALVAICIITFNSHETISNVNGPPAGRSGDPAGGGLTCFNGCHTGNSVQSVTGWITSNIPAAGYSPGETYTITATAAQAGINKYGFQISPQSPSGALLGTLIVTNSIETQLVGTGKYIEHKSAGTNGTGSKTWTFNWVAPPAGTGNVTFYGAFNLANGNGASSGDQIRTTTYVVSECAFSASITSSAGNSVCANNTSTLSATAGSQYSWSNGATTQSIDVGPGNYSVTVTDNGGCAATASFNLGGAQPPTVTATATPASCGQANGAITLTVNGTGPFTYQWNNGATTQNINNLTPGTYSVTVSNVACSATATATVQDSPAPIITLTPTHPTCGLNNGSILVNVTGIGPYSYLWSPTIGNPVNLAPGTYTLIVADALGCTATESVTLVGSSFNPTVATTPTTCGQNNGSATVNASGNPPITFQWDNGATTQSVSNLAPGMHHVTVTDGTGCSVLLMPVIAASQGITLSLNATPAGCGLSDGSITSTVTNASNPVTYIWSNGQTTGNISNLQVAPYTLTVQDANGCSATQTATVVNPDGPVLSAVVTNATCGFGNGSIDLTAVGNGPMIYLWSSASTTEDQTNVFEGCYTAIVTDANGCESIATYCLTTTPPVTINASVTNPSCGLSNGLITANATSGAAPFVFMWNNGSTDNTIDSLAPGSYQVTVTDLDGCFDVETIVLSATPLPVLSAVVTPTGCQQPSGSIDLIVSGGTSPYEFLWADGSTTQNLANLGVGMFYAVTVTDADGCTAFDVYQVTQTTPPTVSIDGAAAAFKDSATAFLATNIAGASYQWFTSDGVITGQGTSSVNVTWNAAGTQTLTVIVTDANGCTTTASTTVAVTQWDAVDALHRSGGSWIVYPNPASSEATLVIESPHSENGLVEIRSVDGRTMLQQSIAYTEGLSRIALSLETLPQGTYFVLVHMENGVTAKLLQVLR